MIKKSPKLYVVVLSLFLVSNVFPVVLGNWGEKIYIPPTPPNPPSSISATSENLYLKEMIMSAGVNFLTSNSEFDLFLSAIESGDYYSMIYFLNRSISFMSESEKIYGMIWREMVNLSYNEEFIKKLKNFDYDQFLNNNNFNPVVFEKVKGFLKKGEVTEIYKQMYLDSGVILSKLKELTYPDDYRKVWDVLQLICDFKIFGSYISQIFYEISIK